MIPATMTHNGRTSSQHPDSKRLSPGLTVATLFALVAGAVLGLVEYHNHAGRTVAHDPSGNATGAFAILGTLLVIAVGVYCLAILDKAALLPPDSASNQSRPHTDSGLSATS